MDLHEFLDHHRRVESPVHRLPAALKLASALIVVGTVIAVPLPQAWPLLGLTAAFLVFVGMASRLPWPFLARRLLLLEPFVLAVAVLSLFRPHGLASFLAMLVRSTICLMTMVLLSGTTPFVELLRALRRFCIPELLVSVVALMYRYLFVLLDESARVRRARSSRTFSSDRVRTWKSSAAIVGQLFVRSSARAERVYAAMCARGWR